MSFVRRRLRLAAVLISVTVPVAGLVLAQPAMAAPGGQAHPGAVAAAPASPVPKNGPAGPVPVHHACAVPKRPGVAACDAIVRTDPAASQQGTVPAGTLPQGYGPADLQSAYKLPSDKAGAGATVAIVDAFDDPTAAADLAVYRQQFGLPACTAATGCFRKVAQDGSSNYPPRDSGWATEISLDLDMVSAACPKCHILLVEASSADATDLGAAVNQAVAQGAKYVSNSYGISADFASESQWDSQFYNHPGVVVTASAGDNGSTLGITSGQFPADSPHVVSVGGTSLTRDPSTPRGWTETTWAGTGSGCGLTQPPWQVGVANTAECGRTRAYSDVSAVADPLTGVAVYDSFGLDGWQVLGGTSASSPLIAAVYALADTPAGGTYPASDLYANHASLNDVTTGNNLAGGVTSGPIVTAEPGWDGPTGWGTPIGTGDFAAGPHGTVAGTVTNAATGAPVAGVQVTVGNATAVTDGAGRYSTTVPDGSYTPSASLFGFSAQTAAAITVPTGGTVRQDFALTKLPLATVTGTVHDASGHGWPLYAEISVPGTPEVTYTDPATGRYSLTLPAGQQYTLHVTAQSHGYQPGDTSITPQAGSQSQDFGLTADPTDCPAGYQQTVSGLNESFDSGAIPSGWTVQSTSILQWVFNDPDNRANPTGGAGGFALVDGPTASRAPGTNPQTTMTSPVFDLSSVTAPVLEFNQDLQLGSSTGGGAAVISLSTDGGQSFRQVYVKSADRDLSAPGPDTEVIPIPQAAGESQVELQFFVNSFSAPTLVWALDNVRVGQVGCQQVSGGLVTGIVRDMNTGQPVSGVTVSGGGQQVTTSPEPNDPAVGGGLYELFAPAGQLSLTASAKGYSNAAADATVTADSVTQAGLTLAAGRLTFSPGKVSVTEAMGAAKTATVRVTNTGSAPATMRLNEQAGAVTLAGASGAAAAGTAAAGPAGAGTAAAPGTARQQAAAAVQATSPPQPGAGPFRPRPGLAGLSKSLRQRLAAGDHAVAPGQAPSPAAPLAAGTLGSGWAPVAHHPDYGFDFAAATDPATGKVYSVGGISSGTVPLGGVTDEGYVYDPAAQSWSQLPGMPGKRAAAVAAVIGGKLYVTGGYGPDGFTNQSSLDVYDPHTGQWSERASVPDAWYGSGSAVLDGKMYVIGGCGADQLGNAVCTTTDVQVYNPATDSWAMAAPYPRQISFLTCGAISGKIYCAGGFDHDLQRGTTAAYVYDPKTDAWSPVASLPADLWGGPGAAADGQLLVSGGITGGDQVITGQGYAYDPASDAWSPLPDASDAAYRSGSACGFYAIGGIDQQGNGLSSNDTQLPGFGECDGGAGVPWLSASPAQATLAPGQSTTVTFTLTADSASVTQPGDYTATVSADSATPYLAPQLPVTLTATPPASWGELTGVVSGRDCTGTAAPVDAATVQVSSAAGSWTLTTDPSGRYEIWLPASDSPLSLITTADNWLSATAMAKLKAGGVTKANVTLTRASCG